MAYWLFQGNPKYYRVLDGIRDFQQMPWLVTRYRKDISVGDGVLIWKAGSAAGVYANCGSDCTRRAPQRHSRSQLLD
ncbi:EVE domain-containing protein [Arthrospira platensis]|uniref:EVE domain-containing protein n=1 Tax=Limnospira platensis TaxID=118562 RepID=UPI001EDBF8B9